MMVIWSLFWGVGVTKIPLFMSSLFLRRKQDPEQLVPLGELLFLAEGNKP